MYGPRHSAVGDPELDWPASAVDLSRENADAGPELPVPATFVVDTAGVVRLAIADPDYKNRLDPEEVVRTVRSLALTPRQ